MKPFIYYKGLPNAFNTQLTSDEQEADALELTVSVDDSSDNHYLVKLTRHGKCCEHTLLATPNDTDILDTIVFIVNAVDALCEDCEEPFIGYIKGNAVQEGAMGILNQAINDLKAGKQVADHHHINFIWEGERFPSDKTIVASFTVELYKNQELLECLNSQTLRAHLAAHPETLVANSIPGGYVEKILMDKVAMDADDIAKTDTMMHIGSKTKLALTPNHYLNHLFAAVPCDTMLFDERGVVIYR